MKWERNERRTRQRRVRWGALRLRRVGTARTETKKEDWSSRGQLLPERTMYRSVFQPLAGHQACVLWKQTLSLLGPAV